MEKKYTTLILSKKDIQELVIHVGLDNIMDQMIRQFENSIRSFDDGTTTIPVRSGFNYNNPNQGLVEWMPIHSHENQVVIKVVGYHPQNPTKFGIPTILSTVSSYDVKTGHLISVVDGVFLTALRTGAASAVASKYLAHENSSLVGLIGCGAQAITQLHGLSRIFDIEHVQFYDNNPATIATFHERCSKLNYNFSLEPTSIENIIRNSDIVCTATSVEPNEGPLFCHLDTKDYLHINAVGSDFPGKIEIPIDLLEKSFVCPDFIGQALLEGECQQLNRNQIGPELVDIVKNEADYIKIRRQRSVFDSTGWALEDKVAMDLLVNLALEYNVGEEVELEIVSEDAKDPYSIAKNIHYVIN